jgi:transcription elongation factor GreA
VIVSREWSVVSGRAGVSRLTPHDSRLTASRIAINKILLFLQAQACRQQIFAFKTCIFRQKKFLSLLIWQRFSISFLGRCYFFLFNNQRRVMSDVIYVTKETLEQLKAELQRMKTIDRPAASKAIAEAREKGDLKENAEYDAAKEAQGLLEARLKKMESDLANVRIVVPKDIDTSTVSILTKVGLTNLNTEKQVTYQIVSEKEADLKLGKISVTSPIGKSLLGKAIGEVVEVQVPAGTLKFKVEHISA